MAQTPTIEELALGERMFLHDIANHIVVAQGMISLALRSLKENPSVDQKEIERLEKSLEAVNKMTLALRERRALLHTLS
jgi:hypothetical protein